MNKAERDQMPNHISYLSCKFLCRGSREKNDLPQLITLDLLMRGKGTNFVIRGNVVIQHELLLLVSAM
jgi:hypothetical protein